MKLKTVAIFPLFAVSILAQQTRTETTTTRTTWNGVLVDAACESTHTERKESVSSNTVEGTTRRQTTHTETVRCPVTTTTSTFGLITSDGRFIRFDQPSNTRVVEVVRGNRALDRYLSERTPLRVSVIGAANGDVAVVETLNPQVTVVESSSPQTEATFDARYHGDRGKLMVTANGVSFEDVSNADHSKSWSYAQIKELKRDGNQIRISPHSGDSFEFRVQGAAMTDAVYQMIADRILAARRR